MITTSRGRFLALSGGELSVFGRGKDLGPSRCGFPRVVGCFGIGVGCGWASLRSPLEVRFGMAGGNVISAPVPCGGDEVD